MEGTGEGEQRLPRWTLPPEPLGSPCCSSASHFFRPRLTMPVASTSDADALDPEFPSGASCRRSSLPPAVRFAIFFGVLFALKLALPYTRLSAAVQVLVLAGAATLLVWRFWWACGESRRGGVLLLAVLWVAAIARIILQA